MAIMDLVRRVLFGTVPGSRTAPRAAPRYPGIAPTGSATATSKPLAEAPAKPAAAKPAAGSSVAAPEADRIIEHKPFALAGSAEAQAGLARCVINTRLSFRQDASTPGGYLVTLGDGTPVGRLTAKNAVALRLAAGMQSLHASVNSMGDPDEAGVYPAARVRVVTGPAGASWAPPLPREYFVGIVGESNYQPAVRKCRTGERVQLLRETGNPHDRNAIVVESERGATIGYIARDSWLHEALLNDGKGCTATIKSVNRGDTFGIVLNVTLVGPPIGARMFRRD